MTGGTASVAVSPAASQGAVDHRPVLISMNWKPPKPKTAQLSRIAYQE